VAEYTWWCKGDVNGTRLERAIELYELSDIPKRLKVAVEEALANHPSHWYLPFMPKMVGKDDEELIYQIAQAHLLRAFSRRPTSLLRANSRFTFGLQQDRRWRRSSRIPFTVYVSPNAN
jgi:hypothetical protein